MQITEQDYNARSELCTCLLNRCMIRLYFFSTSHKVDVDDSNLVRNYGAFESVFNYAIVDNY